MQTLLLYFKLIGVSIKSQMQHRASFFMLTSAMFLSTFVDILGIWVLFERFQVLNGWTLAEMAVMYAIVHMGFALVEATARGFDIFSVLVKNGEFDRMLLRPNSTLLQIISREFQMMRFGRFLQAGVVLTWSFSTLGMSLFSVEGLLVFLAILGTACLFAGLFIIQATLSFWTTETLEIMNITTFGGMEIGQYPITIFPSWFQWIFTVIIPLSLVAYYPAATLLKQENFPFWVGFIFPFAGLLFLVIACQFWHFGVKRYHSTGN